MNSSPAISRTIRTQTLTSRAGQQLMPIGRFKQGVTAPTAEAALKTLATNLERAYPVEQKDQTFMTAPLSRFSISDDPPDDGELTAIAPMLLGMAAVVLLVACLNLANMLLARGTARRKEIAIRLALGGSRWRVVRQLLTEGLLLALLGGAAGLAGRLVVVQDSRLVDAQSAADRYGLERRARICPFSR